jgi:hypothetical protein
MEVVPRVMLMDRGPRFTDMVPESLALAQCRAAAEGV